MSNYANNPTYRRYKEEAFTVHFTNLHAEQSADLTYELMGSEPNAIIRKLFEAHYFLP